MDVVVAASHALEDGVAAPLGGGDDEDEEHDEDDDGGLHRERALALEAAELEGLVVALRAVRACARWREAATRRTSTTRRRCSVTCAASWLCDTAVVSAMV